jgi:hypothetical protein
MFRFVLALFCTFSICSICVARSDEAVLIATGDANGPKQPQAAVSSDGTVYTVFGSGEDIFVCSSNDSGKSFSKPTVAFRVPNVSLGSRRGPRITAYGDTLVISAIGGKQGKGRDGDVLAWRSNDRGVTWKGPVMVNDTADAAREGLHAMAVSSTGEVWCTWLDLRNKRTELVASKSTDGGATWSANEVIYRSSDKNICECCHPSIAIHEKTVHMLFRNSISGNRDMYLTSITFLGNKSKADSIRLGNEHWKLNACPMDGGMLAVDQKGRVSTIWRRGREILLATNDGTDEQLVGVGEQPWIASTANGPVAIWSTRKDGELKMKIADNTEAQTITANARDAVIVAEPKSGKAAYVFWEQNENGRSSVFAKTIPLAKMP